MTLPNKVRLLKDYQGIPAGSVLKRAHGSQYGFYTYEIDELLVYKDAAVIQAFLEVGVCEAVENRWRPSSNEIYFYLYDLVTISRTSHTGYHEDTDRIDQGNCFETKEQAIEASRRVKEVLLAYQEELNK